MLKTPHIVETSPYCSRDRSRRHIIETGERGTLLHWYALLKLLPWAGIQQHFGFIGLVHRRHKIPSISNIGPVVTETIPLGMIALYAYLANTKVELWALVAMIVSLTGASIFLSFIGLGSFALPAGVELYLQGKEGAINVIQAISTGPAFLAAATGAMLLLLGPLILAVAIWRSHALPKWAVIPYILGFALFAATPAFPEIGRLVGGLLITVGGGWLAVSL